MNGTFECMPVRVIAIMITTLIKPIAILVLAVVVAFDIQKYHRIFIVSI